MPAMLQGAYHHDRGICRSAWHRDGWQVSDLSPSLAVSDLFAGYGRMQVVRGVSLEVFPGELVGVLGRNGAGKTTALMAIGGVRRGVASGSVVLMGRESFGRRPHELAEAGLAVVPEGRRIFREMTVADNLRLGAFVRRRVPASELAADLARVYGIFPVLEIYRERLAGQLSGGEQQMVAVGQALMARPRVLLLDEPAAGLSPAVATELYERVRYLAHEGIAVLVVEQAVERALVFAERVYVMEQGRVVLEERAEHLDGEQLSNLIVRGSQPAGS